MYSARGQGDYDVAGPHAKRVRLPRKAASVVDVFGKRVVARDVDEFEFYAPLHSSHLFYLEKP